MANQSGVAIYIKAFLPTGKTVDEQFEALSLISDAKTSGKFDAVLSKATDIEVKDELASGQGFPKGKKAA